MEEGSRIAGDGRRMNVMHMSILNALPASMTLAPLNDVNNGRRRLVSIYPDAAHVDAAPVVPVAPEVPGATPSQNILPDITG